MNISETKKAAMRTVFSYYFGEEITEEEDIQEHVVKKLDKAIIAIIAGLNPDLMLGDVKEALSDIIQIRNILVYENPNLFD